MSVAGNKWSVKDSMEVVQVYVIGEKEACKLLIPFCRDEFR